MTIQMLATWNGLEEDAVYTLAAAEETRLIGLGLARAYAAGMDGNSPVSPPVVVSAANPVNADGRPDGTIWVKV